MIATTYYRSLLSPSEQGVYKDIVTGLLNRRDSIYIKQTPAQIESIRKIVNAVHLDHPELFYVDFWHYQLTQSLLPCGTFLHFRMMLDRDPSAAVMNALKAKTALLQRSAQKKSSREEIYFMIAKEIATTTKYVDTNSAFWEHTVAGPALSHHAVCEGIAKMFLFLCQRISNMPCAVITGTSNGVPHAWNMIELNGVRKYIDVTSVLQTISLYTLVPAALFKSEQALRRSGYDWQWHPY